MRRQTEQTLRVTVTESELLGLAYLDRQGALGAVRIRNPKGYDKELSDDTRVALAAFCSRLALNAAYQRLAAEQP